MRISSTSRRFGPGAGVGVGTRWELAVELGERREAVGEAKLSARRGKRGVLHRSKLCAWIAAYGVIPP
jgi:hypothetical protein